jgi:hypothetical protein
MKQRNAQHFAKKKYRQKFSRTGKSAITHNLNISGHMSVWTIIFYFGVWTSCPKLVPIFQLIYVYAEGFKISHLL